MTELTLSWKKTSDDRWTPLEFANFTNILDIGIYIIWYGGSPSKVVRVGQGIIKDRLSNHAIDKQILTYRSYGMLYVTWASVVPQYRDGIERYLGEMWNPLVGDRFPDAYPIAVNSPWG